MTSILFDDSLDQNVPAVLFTAPDRIISAHHPHQVKTALKDLDKAIGAGYYAAGFFAYEMGYAIEEKLLPLMPKQRAQPLLWFGLFRSAKKLKDTQLQQWLSDQQTQPFYKLKNQTFSMDEATYKKQFNTVKDYIAAGDIYQLNLTLKNQFQLDGCPWQFYAAMRQKQPVHYGVFINSPDFKILSFSPEQFITLKNGKLSTRPMKGTMKRGNSDEEDKSLCQTLFKDPKNRAENLMIVDLMRNDLSKIARAGSVKVQELFKIERYKTLFQMTSLIEASLPQQTSIEKLVSSLFPAGSIIGAPKIRAQEIIAELETQPRGIYTGAIGYFTPTGEAHFNVAIRTVYLDANHMGEIGIGGGIVSDSEAGSEYQECLLKMSFLNI